MNPAVVIVTYNRPDSLKRLLNSISRANYFDFKEIPLVISVDGEGSQRCQDIAEDFVWEYGPKDIISHPKNIGLRQHVINSGELTRIYGGIIVLEDDLFVAPDFYAFALQSIKKYSNDINIAGVSLYGYAYCEFVNAPFYTLDDGFDVYFMQVPSSLGQVWTLRQWESFIEYYNKIDKWDDSNFFPNQINGWPQSSWKKFYYKYIAESGLYFVYPKIPRATNFGDIGTHYSNTAQFLQVPISQNTNSTFKLRLPSLEESLNKYDAFWEIQSDSLKKAGFNPDLSFGVDLFGLKDLQYFNHDYFLSTKDARNFKKKYGFHFLLPFLNVIYDIEGEDITLAKRESFSSGTDHISKLLNSKMNNIGFETGFRQGQQKIVSSKYYRIGFYLLNPIKIFKRLKWKLEDNSNLSKRS